MKLRAPCWPKSNNVCYRTRSGLHIPGCPSRSIYICCDSYVHFVRVSDNNWSRDSTCLAVKVEPGQNTFLHQPISPLCICASWASIVRDEFKPLGTSDFSPSPCTLLVALFFSFVCTQSGLTKDLSWLSYWLHTFPPQLWRSTLLRARPKRHLLLLSRISFTLVALFLSRTANIGSRTLCYWDLRP